MYGERFRSNKFIDPQYDSIEKIRCWYIDRYIFCVFNTDRLKRGHTLNTKCFTHNDVTRIFRCISINAQHIDRLIVSSVKSDLRLYELTAKFIKQ